MPWSKSLMRWHSMEKTKMYWSCYSPCGGVILITKPQRNSNERYEKTYSISFPYVLSWIYLLYFIFDLWVLLRVRLFFIRKECRERACWWSFKGNVDSSIWQIQVIKFPTYESHIQRLQADKQAPTVEKICICINTVFCNASFGSKTSFLTT